MASWKPFWSKHLYPILGLALAVTVLAGGAVFAVVQSSNSSVDASSSPSRTLANRSATVLLQFEPEPTPEAAAPVAEAAEGFAVTCPSAKALPAQNADAFDCKVTSLNGFSAPVSLGCLKPPAGLTCTPDPGTVTPPPHGSVGFHVGLSNNNVKPGKHSFKIVGTSGTLTSSFTWPFDTSGTKAGNYLTEKGANAGCTNLPMNRIARGESMETACNFTASFAFKGSITPSCTAPTGITCSISPNSVAPRFPERAYATLRLTAAPNAPLGKTTVVVTGTSPDFNSEFLPIAELPFETVGAGGATAANDYSIACSPSQKTVPAFTTATINCEVASGSYSGPVSVMWIGLDPNSPLLTQSQGIVQLQPGARVNVTHTLAPTNSSVGTFRYVMTVQHGSAYNFSSAGDTDHSRTVTLTVTPNDVPPPNPSSPPLLPV